jgi:hypothetical protein
MYLREMGSVELLSREGEIAIAKRIEAGRDMMIGGLCESPLTFRAIIAWHDALKAGRMLLRDIIDLEATQGAGAPTEAEVTAVEGEGAANGEAGPDGANDGAADGAPEAAFEAPPPPEDMDGDEDGEGPGLSLSALEEKLKPEVLATFEEIESLYKKLSKMQTKRLETLTSGEEMSSRTEKTYEKLREELVAQVQCCASPKAARSAATTSWSNTAITSSIPAGWKWSPPCPAKAGKPLPRNIPSRSSKCAARSPPSPTMPACRSPNSAASSPPSAAASGIARAPRKK